MSDQSEQLTAYLDGELSAAESAEVEARLAQDPSLRAQAERLRATLTRLKTFPAPVSSPELRRAVLARIAEPTAAERFRAWLAPRRLVPLGLLAAAGVAAVLAVRGPSPLGVESEEQLLVAQNIEVLEDLEVLGLEAADDLEVVAELHRLDGEVTP